MRCRPSVALIASCLCLGGCAPGLGDTGPERFGAAGACDLDVLEHLLIPRCGRGGCHDAEQASAGLEFTTGGVADRLVDVEATQCPARRLVDSVDPSASFLLERLRSEPSCAGVPLEGVHDVVLSDDEMACVVRWVESIVVEPRDGGTPTPFDGGSRDSGVDSGLGAAGADDAGPADVPGRVEIEAESMTLTGYVVDPRDPNVVRLPMGVTSGAAATTFDGVASTYMISVHVVAESDGHPTYEVLVEGTSVHLETLALSPLAMEPTVIGPVPVTLARGDTIEIRGQPEGGAWARIDRLVLRP